MLWRHIGAQWPITGQHAPTCQGLVTPWLVERSDSGRKVPPAGAGVFESGQRWMLPSLSAGLWARFCRSCCYWAPAAVPKNRNWTTWPAAPWWSCWTRAITSDCTHTTSNTAQVRPVRFPKEVLVWLSSAATQTDRFEMWTWYHLGWTGPELQNSAAWLRQSVSSGDRGVTRFSGGPRAQQGPL